MKKYRIWLEPNVAGVTHEDYINIPEDASEKEIDEICKDVAFNWIDWGYHPVEELEE